MSSFSVNPSLLCTSIPTDAMQLEAEKNKKADTTESIALASLPFGETKERHATSTPPSKQLVKVTMPCELSRFNSQLQPLILSFFGVREGVQLSKVCKNWQMIMEDDTTMRKLMMGRLPVITQQIGSSGAQALWRTAYRTWKAEGNCTFTPKHLLQISSWFEVEYIHHGKRSQPILCAQTVGDRHIIGCFDHCVRIVDRSSGKELSSLRLGGTVLALKVRKDILVTADTSKKINLWNWKEGKLLKTLEGHTDTVTSLDIWGDIIVSGSADKTLRTWNLKTGEPLKVFAGHDQRVACVKIKADTREVFSGSCDGTVRCFDLDAGMETRPAIKGSIYQIVSMDLFENRLVFGDQKGMVTVYDLSKNILAQQFNASEGFVASLLLLDEDRLVVGIPLSLRIFDLSHANKSKADALETLKFGQKMARCITPHEGGFLTGDSEGCLTEWNFGKSAPKRNFRRF
jgi:hypothetical protein